MYELRPYQAEAKQAILSAWDEGQRKTLLVLPTGCGKTVVFASVTENQVNKRHRVLILAHRGELLDQASEKLKEAAGLDSVLEKADSSALGSFLPVTVGSVQSLAQPKRLAKFPEDYYQDIIVDEAHHCLSDSYQNVLSHFPEANILGVTATPDRGDMKNLGEFFDSKAYEYSMTDAIREGYLCPIQAAKEYLKRIARAEANIKAKKERLTVMREMSMSVGSPEMSDMTKNPNRSASRLEDTMIRVVSLESEIRRDEDRLQAAKTAALDLIGRIPNPEYQTVLISRYFRNKTWEEISQEMYYSISWIYRLHGYALEELNGILAEECS